jgi:lysozyme family protein
MIISGDRIDEFTHEAQHIINHKAQYKPIEDATGVPWAMIGIIHLRESNCNFATYLGNGQLLTHRTTIVPKGRGPFASFYDGAVDALKFDGLASIHDWRLEKILYYCESFNGFGYEMYHGVPSPYIWGGTNIQKIGKYVSDGHWNGAVWDPQPGCAPVLRKIMDLDPTVTFERES